MLRKRHGKAVNRRGGDCRRRPGRADRGDCAGRGRHRDRADRAAAASPDHRTTALLAGSVTALDTLGVWAALRGAGRAAPGHADRRCHRPADPRAGGPLRGLRDRARRVRPQHREPASPRRARRARADLAVADRGSRTKPARCETSDSGVTVTLEGGGRIAARLVIGADGRRSLCRAAAGIESDGHAYPQTALTFNLAHTRPHHDTSTEFHTESGPFTLVPLPGERSSLVCVVEPAEAERIAALDDAALDDEIERRSHSILGKITVEPGRGVFRSRSRRCGRFAQNRIALVGEAAHLIPPIGAQGLNLGLRDAATHRRARGGGAPRRRRRRRARSAGALRRAAPRRREKPHACRRSAQPHAARPISCRCRARAASAST